MANIRKVTDFSDPELDIYARLTEVQLLNRREPDKGIFIAESPKVIERALNAGCVPISFLMETRHVENQAKELIARCGDIPVFTAELDVLTQLTGFKLTRGMLCAMYRPKLPFISLIVNFAVCLFIYSSLPFNKFDRCGVGVNGDIGHGAAFNGHYPVRHRGQRLIVRYNDDGHAVFAAAILQKLQNRLAGLVVKCARRLVTQK